MICGLYSIAGPVAAIGTRHLAFDSRFTLPSGPGGRAVDRVLVALLARNGFGPLPFRPGGRVVNVVLVALGYGV